MRDDLKTELVLDALGMAAHTRETAGVIAHSDHGSQYTSLAYGSHAKESGIDLSMGSVGDPWDNALAETFFASLEKELLKRERFTTREHARMRNLLVHRMLLQPPPTPLQPRHAQPHQLRTTTPNKGHRGLDPRCQPKRVNSRSALHSRRLLWLRCPLCWRYVALVL